MEKPKKKWTWWKIVGLVFIGSVVLAAIQGKGTAPVVQNGQQQTEVSESKDHARLMKRLQRQFKANGDSFTTVTPAALYRAYQSNEVAADNKYKGQWVQLTGVIASVNKDFTGDPVLVFAADQYGVAQVHADLFDVQILEQLIEQKDFTTCTALEKAGALAAGQRVMVEGLGAGSVLGMPMLKECLIYAPQ